MKAAIFLSFLAGFMFALIFWGAAHSSGDTLANGFSFPGQDCLRHVSAWVYRNEIWHDYRLSEEAEAAGLKIRAVRSDGNLISIRVSP